MAKIPLKAYVNEIEQIIAQRQTEEAIAHCRHILQFFPKHLETYRLLGKAYLESQRFANAADIFQRVLSAVPDDFISHVGMSIIREDENDLDAAIWHMERAFEGQPYNTAIQGELRRLFGRRDSMEPPKIHLTRGALARMYVKGNLYQQAIAELRAAIAENPQRYDLRVLLAQMYAQNEDQAKAIETCSGIIAKLPFCLVANRILAKELAKTERSNEARIYQKRLEELDPYEAYLAPNTPSADQVPDQAVTIEQLLWDGGPVAGIPTQPEWATALGIDLDDSNLLGEGVPDWMSKAESELPALPSESEGASAPDEDLIPDWMKEAGWAPSTGQFDESQSAFSFEEDQELTAESSEAIAGNIPDWLQQIAPPGAIETPDEIEEEPFDFSLERDKKGEALEWLQEAGDEARDEDSSLPEWLTSMPSAATAAASIAAAAYSSDSSELEAEDAEIPDWLAEPAETLETENAEIPDWLQEPAETLEAEAAEIPDWLAEPAETLETEAAEIPDWLQEPAETLEAEAAEIPDWLQEPAEALEAEAAEIPDWLQEPAETLEAEAAEIPDWLAEPAETLETEDAEIPDWLQEPAEALEAEDAGQIGTELLVEREEDFPDLDSADAAMAWLESLSIEDLSDDLLLSSPDKDLESAPDRIQADDEEIETLPDIPDWLAEPTETLEAEAAEIPDWLQELAAEEPLEPILETDSGDSLTDIDSGEDIDRIQWAAYQDESDREIEQAIGEIESELPGWLQDIPQESAMPSPSPESIANDDAIPAWLQDIGEEIPTIAGETEIAVASPIQSELGDIPSWMQDIAEEETLLAEDEPIASADQVSAMLNSDDADAAMAWLESLAAKQGVSEDELLSSPEERDDTPPAWVQEIASAQDEPEMLVEISEQDEIEGWIAEVSVTPEADSTAFGASPSLEPELTPKKTTAEFEVDDLETAMAWLDNLAGLDGISEEELLSTPEEAQEQQPIAASEPAEDAATRDDLSGWIEEVPESEETTIPPGLESDTPAPDTAEVGDLDSALAWLESLAAKQGVSEEELLTHPSDRRDTPPLWVQQAVQAEAIEEPTQPEAEFLPGISEPTQISEAPVTAARLESAEEEGFLPEPPSWITDGHIPEDDFSFLPPDISEMISAEAEELIDLNEASLIQLERLPGVGFRRAQAITAYRDEKGKFRQLDELYDVPGLDEDTIALLKTRVTVPAPEVTTQAESLPEMSIFAPLEGQAESEWHNQQLAARAKLMDGNVAGAVADYDLLIENGQQLEFVIEDLNKASEQFSQEFDLLRVLGDACLRANRLQEALDAYTRAEESLQ